jgi:hypothetical protein
MSVRSQPLRDGKVVHDQVSDATEQLAWRAADLFAIVVGGAFWLIGARYTVFGAPLVIAHLLGLFGIVAPITLPIGWPLLGLTVVIGVIVSLMEFGARPRRAFFAKSLLIGLVLVFLWALVNTGDFASTASAVFYPGRAASALAQWTAAAPLAAIPWICFLTWTPELLIIAGWRWLINGRF